MSNCITLKEPIFKTMEYSDEYKKIRKEAESLWPAWKVIVYNSSIAISAHAKKVEIEQQGRD